MILCAELATGHGGDLALAEDMIRAAADAGCDFAKTQAYEASSINASDPQRDWLTQAALSRDDHARLIDLCAHLRIGYLSTPFDAGSLQMLRSLGQTAFKIASSESGHDWWSILPGETWYVSYPWGQRPKRCGWRGSLALTAIPLYPTPLEAVGRAQLLDGWSDHCNGLSACMWAIAHGVSVLEAHLCLPDRGRRMPWDKLPQDFATLRRFADDCETMRSGVGQTFRERWKR